MKEFCKNTNICRRTVVSDYFGALTDEAPINCCDICQGTLSDKLTPTPTLKQRQMMRDALNAYMHSYTDDKTGLNDTLINTISDVFEFFSEESQICDTFLNVEVQVAATILKVKSAILSL